MKILVSNDDGIDSPGIYALANSLKEIGEVTVVAPRNEQSAVGHGITMQYPLRVTEYFKNDIFLVMQLMELQLIASKWVSGIL